MPIRVRRADIEKWIWTLFAGVPVSLWLFGFTVDDALISVRVAQNLANGSGYRFNAGGPVVDAVTPLGWAQVLALLNEPSPWEMLFSARLLGLLAWWVALVLLGSRISTLGQSPRRWLPLLPLALSAPLGAWCSSGMETGVVTLLATIAVCEGKWALLAAGLAAAWRPELLGWAVVLGVGKGWSGLETGRIQRLSVALASVSAPFVLVAVVRVIVFGQAAPLSAIAKPTDLEQGMFYAAGAWLWTGFPWLLVSPSFNKLAPEFRIIGAAALVHFACVGLVGGDWMALYRLVVPVLPSLVLLGAAVCEQSSWRGSLVRLALATAANAVLLARLGPVARNVVEQRTFLSEQAEPFLNAGGTVGTLDVGWVGAAAHGEIFDFAGVTDPEIARLCCGHHAKKIDRQLLEQRGVTTLVLLLAPKAQVASPWWQSEFDRFSENYVARQLKEQKWAVVAELPLKNTEQHYVILRRTDAAMVRMLGEKHQGLEAVSLAALPARAASACLNDRTSAKRSRAR